MNRNVDVLSAAGIHRHRMPQPTRRFPDSLPAGSSPICRRHFLRGAGAAAGLAALARFSPAWAQPAHAGHGGVTDAPPAPARPQPLAGQPNVVDLVVERTDLRLEGRMGHLVTANGTLPGPLLRFREGEEVELRVTNRLRERTAIHWHGLLVPAEMDGVPGVSFKGIEPGETFVYRFPLKQYGTYWYHAHIAMQEQLGLYGPIVIDPAAEPFSYAREHVIVLSDWTFSDPHDLFAKLKKRSNFSNMQRRTALDFYRDVRRKGLAEAWADWGAWARMRMDPTDIADLTGQHFSYLLNGRTADNAWTGLFNPGERVRLRFINAAATTHFDVRIPGLHMTVVQADGQHVQPVRVEEFRMGAAETYDVIVEPADEKPYAIFAETTDRSGYAFGTLAPRERMLAPIPTPRRRPVRTMADMGMASHDSAGSAMGSSGNPATTGPTAAHAAHGAPHGSSPNGHTVGPIQPASEVVSENHARHGGAARPPPAEAASHHLKMDMPDNQFGPGNAMMAMSPVSRAHEPGLGLGGDGWRVLVYRDLVALESRRMPPPQREIVMNLTGNMERFIWGFDGKKFSEAEPIRLRFGERVRITFINQTMMEHPLHLHGMFMELENGARGLAPLKHTVIVKPAEKLSVLVTADARGHWAFHCHLQYHMEAGMFRVFEVA